MIDEPGWVLGQTALAELGVAPGMVLSAGNLRANVVHVVGAGGRQLGYDRDVITLVTSGTRTFSVCWVELEPASFGFGDDIIAGLFPYDDTAIRPFRRTEPADHPIARYLTRSSQHAWIASGAAAGIFWLLWWWIRRREFALYRSLHVPPSGVMLVALGEATVLSSVSALGAVAIVVLTSQTTSATLLGLWTVGAATILSLLIAAATAWPVACRKLVIATKEM